MKSSGQWLVVSGQHRVAKEGGRLRPNQACAGRSGRIRPNPTAKEWLVASGQWLGGRLRLNRAQSNRIKPARADQGKSNQIQPNPTGGNEVQSSLSPSQTGKVGPSPTQDSVGETPTEAVGTTALPTIHYGLGRLLGTLFLPCAPGTGAQNLILLCGSKSIE